MTQNKQKLSKDLMFIIRHFSDQILKRFLISKVKNAFWTDELLSN